MKDQRLKAFRIAVDSLTESLEAVVRVSRWTGDAPPEALSAAASQLVERLGTANRLVATPFQGTPTDARVVNAMCAVMKRLDAAYTAYQARIASTPDQVIDAAAALEFDIAEATSGAHASA
jgi:hypothetical protein